MHGIAENTGGFTGRTRANTALLTTVAGVVGNIADCGGGNIDAAFGGGFNIV